LGIQKEEYLQATETKPATFCRKMGIKERAAGNCMLLRHKENFLPRLWDTLPRKKPIPRPTIFKFLQSVHKKAKKA